eukprot:m51a1_g8748 hypothetical protein (160) ;mRNA; f:73805-74685
MSSVQVENERLKQELVGAERAVVQMHDALASSKIDRDALRAANVQLQKSNGLVGAMDLLRDFDGNRVALNEATARLQELRAEHAQDHMTEGCVLYTKKACVHKGCREKPRWGLEGRRTVYCDMHKGPEHVLAAPPRKNKRTRSDSGSSSRHSYSEDSDM